MDAKWKDLDDEKLMMMAHRLSSFPLAEFVDRKEALDAFKVYLSNPETVKGPTLFAVHAGPGAGKTKFLQELCDRKPEVVGKEIAAKLEGFVPLTINWNLFSPVDIDLDSKHPRFEPEQTTPLAASVRHVPSNVGRFRPWRRLVPALDLHLALSASESLRMKSQSMSKPGTRKPRTADLTLIPIPSLKSASHQRFQGGWASADGMLAGRFGVETFQKPFF